MSIPRFKGFYARSSVFTILSLVSAVFGYLLYPVLVRILNPTEFGDFAAVMAALNQTLAVLAAVTVVSVYLVKSYGEKEARDKVQIVQKVLLWLFFGLILLVMLLSPALGHYLKISGLGMFGVLGLTLLLSVPVTLWTGYLQGHKELVRVGLFTLTSTFSRLLIALVLAYFFGTMGALLGVLFGTIMGIITMRAYPGIQLPRLRSSLSPLTQSERSYFSSIRLYVLQSIFVVGGLGILQNIDITIAKLLFNPEVAGLYSGVSILSNSLYYLCFVLVWIVIPEIDIKNKAINGRVLGTAYKAIGALTVIVLGIEYMFRDFLTQLLLGDQFAQQGNLLIFASLFQLGLVSIVLYAFYLLVCRRRESILLTVLVIGCAVSFPLLFGSTPLAMIKSLCAALFIAVSLYGVIGIAVRSLRLSKV